MTDSRRDFLLRFAATALVATGASALAAETQIGVVDGPPPGESREAERIFYDMIGGTIFFEADKASLTAKAKAVLDRQIDWLRRNSSYTVILEGHTDDRCSREYCLGLGERQARSVQAYMSAHGIPSDRIKVVSYGQERPAVRGDTEVARARNRRVATVLQGR